MIFFDKINVSQRMNISGDGNFRALYALVNVNYRFQPNLYRACHNLMIIKLRFNKVVIISVKSKTEAKQYKKT